MPLDTTTAGTASDSYATLAQYQTWAINFGATLSDLDVTNEKNLRKAAAYIDATYKFKGFRDTKEQALSWPRRHVGYVDGWWIDSGTIPQDIKTAQMEMAYYIQGGSTPMAVFEGTVKRKREKADVLEEETEYFGGKGRPRYTAVERLLRDYIASGPGHTGIVRG